MEQNQQEQLCCLLLDVGERLIECGAESSRVEDTLKRIGRAYGAVHMNVFVITSTVTLTISFPDDKMITHTRRINHSASTDFRMLEAINALSRKGVAGKVTMEEFSKELQALTAPQEYWTMYLGSIIATAGFCIFYKGTVWDAIISALLGVLIYRIQKNGSIFPNRVIYFLITSFLTGFAGCVIVKCIPSLHLDKILIGDIMLLTPGIAITNAMRDALVGDTISGSMKLIESVIWAGALACGIMAAMWMVRV